jgi:hypothetical protein
MYQICHTWIHPLHHSLYPYSPPIPGIVSTVIIFTLTYICIQYLNHIHPPTPFPPNTPLWLVPPPPPLQDIFHPPVLGFCRRKKKRNGIFACLRYLHREFSCGISVYYNTNCFIYFIFLHITLVPFLWWIQPVLTFYIHSCIETTIDHIRLNFLLLPYPSLCDFPLLWPVFHSIAIFVLGLYSTYERKHMAFGLLNLANST